MRKERPILFSTPMVQAILEGRKTQTRRVIKGIPNHIHNGINIMEWPLSGLYYENEGYTAHVQSDVDDYVSIDIKCPYKPGDILWVRETWAEGHSGFVYRADNNATPSKWKPSIFMPREACRIKLEITNVRVERLQDISSHDAIHEGIEAIEPAKRDGDEMIYKSYAKIKHLQMLPLFPYPSFRTLWQSINGFESWNSNPYVWVVEFKRVHP